MRVLALVFQVRKVAVGGLVAVVLVSVSLLVVACVELTMVVGVTVMVGDVTLAV